MESRLKFRPRLSVLNRTGTLERSGERPCGWPSNGVGCGNDSRRDGEAAGQPNAKSSWSRQARKAVRGAYMMSVP